MSKRIIVENKYLRKPVSRAGHWWAPMIFDRLSCNRVAIYVSDADCQEVVDSRLTNKASSARDAQIAPTHKLVRDNKYWLFVREVER